jgi:lipid-A-disaccharide synthase
MPERITIIAGESSGELYGALLAEALKSEYPGISVSGVGGVRMKAAGVELIAGITSAFGGVEALKKLRAIKKTFLRVVSFLKEQRPQVLVLIDYPSFNLRLAREAKKLGIPVFYYVSPHVWAWRKWRIKTIKKNAGIIALTLPFEVPIYQGAGVPCRFVGHPVMDEIRHELEGFGLGLEHIGSQQLRAKARHELGIHNASMVMTVMPGSRSHEIKTLLPVISDVIGEMRTRYQDCRIILPVAPNLDESLLERHRLPAGCIVLKGDAIKALMASDLAVIASGTATFQSALLNVPMVVIYKLNALSFFIAKSMVNLNYISLANLLLERSVADDSGLRAKEFVQEDVNAANIISELVRIREDHAYRNEFLKQLRKVRGLFEDSNASRNVARLIGEFYRAQIN